MNEASLPTNGSPDLRRISEAVPSQPLPDDTAKKEAAEVAAGNYDENESARSDRFRHHVHLAMLGGVWLVAALMAVAIISVAGRYLLPHNYEWLSDDQLSTLQTFLFSSAVTGIGGGYFRARIWGFSQ